MAQLRGVAAEVAADAEARRTAAAARKVRVENATKP
jgi:hypothetical protein